MHQSFDHYATRDAVETKRAWKRNEYHIMPDSHAVCRSVLNSRVDALVHEFDWRGLPTLEGIRKGPSYAQLLLMTGDTYPEVDTAINTTVSESEDHFDYEAYNSRTIYNR